MRPRESTDSRVKAVVFRTKEFAILPKNHREPNKDIKKGVIWLDEHFPKITLATFRGRNEMRQDLKQGIHFKDTNTGISQINDTDYTICL